MGVSSARPTYTHGVDSHRLSSSDALAWAGRGPWSLGGSEETSPEDAAVLRPEVDADGTRILLGRREALWAGLTPLVLLAAMLSTIRLPWGWRAAAVVAAGAVVLVAGAVRAAGESRVARAVEAGGPPAGLLATCVPDRSGWRLDLAAHDAPDLVLASVRRPVLGTAVARFADREASRAPSPEALRRAPWRAWSGEPVLVVGGSSGRVVAALRATDGGPWVLSRGRRGPVRRPRPVSAEQQGAPA